MEQFDRVNNQRTFKAAHAFWQDEHKREERGRRVKESVARHREEQAGKAGAGGDNTSFSDARRQTEQGLYWNRLELPVTGPPVFCAVIGLILSDLRTKAPRRYQEVIGNLPKAEYAPLFINQFAGRTDGLFSIDGSGYAVGRLNTYEWLRFVLLHEAGHGVGRTTSAAPYIPFSNRFAKLSR